MVRLEDHGTQGPARNIQIVNSHFTSGDLPEIQDWLDHVSDGMRLYSDDGPVVARCNEMTRVAMGFVASGSHIDLIGNRVEFFSRDGIATGGHFNRFVGNRSSTRWPWGMGITTTSSRATWAPAPTPPRMWRSPAISS